MNQPEEDQKEPDEETRMAQRHAGAAAAPGGRGAGGDRVLIVPPEAAGWRLDRFLAEAFKRHSRNKIARLLKAGGVRLRGVPAKPGWVLKGGERLAIPRLDEAVERVEAARESAPRPPPVAKATDVPVLYRDEDVLVVNKPPGVPCHGGAGLGATKTLLELLVGDVLKGFNIVHRLDRETSGVTVLVRDAALRATMSEAFAADDASPEKRVEKVYDALVEGVPAESSGTVDLPLADPGHGTTGRVDRTRGKPATTDWTVVESFGDAARLRVLPRTGRTHQIRLHLEAIGHPLLVDSLYGRRSGWRMVDPKGGPAARLTRTPLHASDLSFPHPKTGEIVRAHAPLWPDMRRAYEVLRIRGSHGAPKLPVK